MFGSCFRAAGKYKKANAAKQFVDSAKSGCYSWPRFNPTPYARYGSQRPDLVGPSCAVRVRERCVVLIRNNWSEHMPWIVACLAVTAASIAWFVLACIGQAAYPSGSSLPGFTFGVVGGAICFFEFLLWPRKKVRTWRIGRVQSWMRAHIWLGLLAVPLLVLHTGFRWGGTFSTVLMVLFLVVIASGIWGVVLQQFIPQTMLTEVPAETIYSQMGHVTRQFAEEADRLVLATCGPELGPNGQVLQTRAEANDESPAQFLVVGAVRSAGGVQGKVLSTRAPKAPVPNSESLRSVFRRTVEPYLLGGKASGSPLSNPTRAASVFQEVRTSVPPAAHETVNALEEMCEQRRQLDLQARLHCWLHSWLSVHLPLSAALIILMFVHVYVALKYM